MSGIYDDCLSCIHGDDCDYEEECYPELSPDEQREEDRYIHGDYLGDIEREEG